MNRRLGCFLGVVLVLLVVSSSTRDAAASDDEELRIGVVVVSTLGVDESEAQAIADRLRQALVEMLLVVVPGAGDMAGQLGEPVADSCVGEAECIRQVSDKLGTTELLFLAIVRIGGRVQINVTWADGATGATEARDPIRIEDAARERIILAQSATRLLPNARRRPDAPDPLVVTVVSGPDRHMTRGTWIAGSAGLLALAGGVTFGILAVRADNDLDKASAGGLPENDPTVRDLQDKARLRINIADACFAAAAVAGVTAAILYWRSGGNGDKPAMDVALHPGVTPASVHLALTARF